MMKQLIFTGALLLASAMTGEAMAQCTTGRVNSVSALTTLLSGNTICVSNGAGGWDSQEEHIAGGVLMDYKKGPSDRVDPTKVLGTWHVSGPALPPANTIVTYNYTAWTPNQSYAYLVYLNSGTLNQAGSTYAFCTSPGGTPVVIGTLKAGTGAGC